MKHACGDDISAITEELRGFSSRRSLLFALRSQEVLSIAPTIDKNRVEVAEEVAVQQRLYDRLPRTIRRNELRQLVPLADTTIYDMEQRGEFPRRFALTARCVVWDLAEVEAWLASRRVTPVTRAPRPDVRQRRTRPVKQTDPER